ncbi:alpha 1,6-fucosyltransferase [Klebsormidium nitens]|uniref:Alpha 1,6-fucosyltransferase n=1 Tax=Klebsormidium nitens TaxID=105231 RepID=A0A1Y1IHW0_KLENI|nr:alpha 1,6-fucosyltransferase [Klebsormidium nitens]|eukprot:GAQ88661.1 alpha 1,6-fucosyltransferase [Klebsormidium nitens]
MWGRKQLASIPRRDGIIVYLALVVVSLLLLSKFCSFLYFAGFKAGAGQAGSEIAGSDFASQISIPSWSELSDKLAATPDNLWDDIWKKHAGVLRNVTRVKTLLDSQRRLVKPGPEKENQDIAGVQLLLSQSLQEMQAATRVEEIQAWVKREVSENLERVLNELQFPEDCESARKLVCELDKGCGFGCQVHHVVHCFANAVALNRTMLLKVTPWRYAPTGHWNDVFLPVTHCPFPEDDRNSWGPEIGASQTHDASPSVFMQIIDTHQTVYDPPAMPFDVQEAVRLFHARPEIWWVGALAKFLLRPSEASVARLRRMALDEGGGPSVATGAEEQSLLSGGKELSGVPRGVPFVGVHIRRSDKVTVKEANAYEVLQYMRHVEAFCDSKLPSGWQTRSGSDSSTSQTGGERNSSTRQSSGGDYFDACVIYVATDEPAVLRDITDNFPHLKLVGNNTVNALAADVGQRNSFEGLLGIYDDVIHLSRADYLVGTLSSQVTRLAYEIMQHRNDIVDASFTYQSLDSVWYYGGQPSCRYCATSDYTAGGQRVVLKGDELHCDVIVQKTGGMIECRNERVGAKMWVPSGIVDWCPTPASSFQFRDVLPPYMSGKHLRRD